MKARFFPLAMMAGILLSCTHTPQANPNAIQISDNDLIQTSFGGLGVEWGVYEDTDKLDEASWNRVYGNMDLLSPQMVRLMVNYDWFVENFDDKNDDDKSNDTWTYNFANKWGQNMFDLLTYCQKKRIEVAFGAWNVIGSVVYDEWTMFEDSTSDPRWAKISVDVMDYLVNKLGFTCIRYLVNGNEPNFTGVKGVSKNYANTFAKWSQGVKNIHAELNKRNLGHIKIVGGDTTGLQGTDEYFTGIAEGLSQYVGDYGAHLYLSNYYIDNGLVQEEIEKMNAKIHAIDSGYGTERPVHIWECGLLDGKNPTTDSNSLIKTVSYGVLMADFTTQCLLSGINGITYWDFDDGMHFMYGEDGATSKKWGMFSSLSSDQSVDQERRPWFYSSALLTHLFRKGSKIYRGLSDKNFRSVAMVNDELGQAGMVLVNRGLDDVEKEVSLTATHTKGEKLYVYLFGEGYLRVNEKGIVIPNQIIDGDLGDNLKLKIPSDTVMIVSKEAL